MSEEPVITYLFEKVAKRLPDKICLQIERDGVWKKYTYAEVEEISRKIGAFLISEGIERGDFVLLILENSPEWAISYLGILCSGACAVPLDVQLTTKEIENITADCRPKAIFVSEHIFRRGDFENLKSRFKKIIVSKLPVEARNENNVIDFKFIKSYHISENIKFPELFPEDNASLIYTSGTTGKPKGVLLSHANFCSNVKSLSKLRIFAEKDVFLSILPLFHSYAFMAGLLVPLINGSSVTFCLSFKPEDVARTIKESSVTIVPTVPQFLTLLRDKIFSKYDESPTILRPLVLFFTRIKVRRVFGKGLRLFVSGGARLEPAIGRDISRLGIELVEGYGLTETSPVVTISPPGRVKFGSVGKPIPEVGVRIDNPDDSGTGEVLIKGPNVMKGYFKQPLLTSNVIKNGWFYSGDLGYLDEEGYLYITGRLKEVIVLSSGKNIYPEELEEIYSLSPYIKELCILSRDDQRGLYAVIVPDFSYFRQTNVANIRDKIRWEIENITKNLPPHNHIMGFTIVKEELPRTRLGKIKRFELQKRYAKVEGYKEKEEKVYSGAELDLIHLDTSKKILNFLSKKLKKDIDLDDHLELDLGIDSLGRVELADRLEAFLNIEIPNELMAKVFTVRELLSEVSTLGKGKTAEKPEKKSFEWKELLSKLPPEEIVRKIRLNPSVWDKVVIFIMLKFSFYIFRIFWRLKVEGRDRLPKKGAYILCPNHASYLDGFIVGTSIPYAIELNTFFLGYAGYFEHPLAAWGIRLGRLIPLDPNIRLVEAMQASSYVLRNDKIMCIFPEGRRSVDENVQDFKKGVGILAKELDIPLVPVYIKGSHFAWPRTNRFLRLYPLKITFGYPLSAEELLKRSKERDVDDYEKIVSALREEVLKIGDVSK